MIKSSAPSLFNDIFVSENLPLFLWIGTVTFIIITFLLAIYKVKSSTSSVALHYNVLIGVDLLGQKSRLYLVPLTAVIIAVINFVLTKVLDPTNTFLMIMLAAGSFVSSVIIFWAFLLLFSVN